MYGWQPQNSENIPVNLSYWLTKVKHLKLALTQHDLQPELQLLDQQMVSFCSEEAELLGTETGCLREIYLGKGPRKYTYGRTLIPNTTYEAFATEFVTLKEQAIGEILLHNKEHVTRGPFEYGIILPDSLLFDRASGDRVITTSLWGRRSFFYMHELPLLIIEIFLDLPPYDCKKAD